MRTTTQTTTVTTAISCPSWCTVDHREVPPGAGFHAGRSLDDSHIVTGRLWQQDREGASPGVVIAGELLTEGQAHDIGLELVRAADVLRREAQR